MDMETAGPGVPGAAANLAVGTAGPRAPGTAAGAAVRADALVAPTKLTQEERRVRVCLYLRTRISHSKLPRGALDEAARRYQYSKRSVSSIWSLNRNAILHPEKYELDVARKKGTGTTSKRTAAEIQRAVNNVPHRHRQTLRSLAEKTGIPHASLSRHFKTSGQTVVQKSNAGAVGEKETGEAGRRTVSQQVQQDMQRIKLHQEMKAHYEKQTEKAVQEAKREARREHNQHLETLRRGLQQQFQSDKERALFQLKVEMERHSLELTRLKGLLDTIGEPCAAEKGEDRDRETARECSGVPQGLIITVPAATEQEDRHEGHRGGA